MKLYEAINRLPKEEFGVLQVIEFNGYNKHLQRVWKCKCICGKYRNITETNLLNKRYKKCTCNRVLNRNTKLIIPNIPFDVGYKMVYKRYFNSAKKRNLDFELSMQEAIVFFTGNCYYCGDPPSNEIRGIKTPLLYNGIDRVDNTIGYYLENCVSCCSICNRMKNTLSKNDFINKINKIYELHR